MRKLYTSTIGIFLTFLFISCTQFTADIEDVFLSYWSTEVASTNFTIDTPYTRVGEMPYVSSAEDVIVTIKLRNPKKLTLKMPTMLSVFRGCLLNLSTVQQKTIPSRKRQAINSPSHIRKIFYKRTNGVQAISEPRLPSLLMTIESLTSDSV